MNVKPLGNRVLIKMKEQEEKTAGGIYIPETASQDKTQQGSVVAVGTDEDINVKVGDEVIYDKYAGTSINIDDLEHLLLSSDDILAVVS